MLVRAIFRTTPAIDTDGHDFFFESEYRTSVVDNLIASLTDRSADLIDIADYFDEPDSGEDLPDEHPSENATFFDIAIDLDDELLPDWSRHREEIFDSTASILAENLWTVFASWERGQSVHIGITTLLPHDERLIPGKN